MGKKYLLIFMFILLLIDKNAYCLTETEKQGDTAAEFNNIGVKSPVNFPKVTRIMKTTGFVVVIIVITVYLLRKKLGIQTSLNRRRRYVHIVDTASLGSKKHLHLIKIPGKLVLIGAANDRIQSLAEITEKEIVESIDIESQSSEFAKFFKRTNRERV